MGRRRRLLRILLNAATAVSLVLCVATTAVWVRSRWMTDVFAHFATTVDMRIGERCVMSRRGAVVWARQSGYYRMHAEGLTLGAWQHRAYWTDAADQRPPAAFVLSQPTAWQESGFVYHNGSQDESSWNWPYPPPDFVVGLPYWAACLPMAALPLAQLPSLLRYVRARRRRQCDRCPACGYDLRATPDRCPECGTVPSAPP